MTSPTGFPKLAPDCVPRPELEAWLDRHAGLALRAVAAQPGAGKTAGVALWARRRADRAAWITVPVGATRSDVCALLMCALAAAQTDTLAHALHSATKTIIIVDDADRADTEARALLAGLPTTAGGGVAFVYLMRNRRALGMHGAPGAGVAIASPSLLRFDEREIDRLCAVHGLAGLPGEKRSLLADTSGWAIAVAGTVRYAAAIGSTFGTAYERWLTTSRPFLDDLIAEAVGAARPEIATAFHRVLTGQSSAAAPELAGFASAGLFVDDVDGTYRMNPVIAAFERREDRRPRLAPAQLHVFGRFGMTIGDREVSFARRRDRQIVQFLALQPARSATRAELIDALLPGVDPDVAAQAIRSACVTLRRSFAECVGRANVSAYFRVDGNLVLLDPERVTSSEVRFRSHVELATHAEELAELDAAFAHWSAAAAIYVAPLLAGEAPAAWMEPLRGELDGLAQRAAERVRNLAYVELVQNGIVLTA